MNKLVLFSAQHTNGKDESGNYLAELIRCQSGESWCRMAFADAVKDTFCRSFGVTREFIETWKRKDEPPPGFSKSIRKSLQFIGDGFREILDSCWIDMAMQAVQGNSIISDGRYINEGRAIYNQGGVNILVWRPGYENDDPNRSEAEIRPLINYCLATKQDGPINIVPSSNPPYGIEFYHYFLRNDGDVTHLQTRIKEKLFSFIAEKFGR